MQPNPSAETSRPSFPSFRFFIVSPLLQVRTGCAKGGIPILRIYCLILWLASQAVNPQTNCAALSYNETFIGHSAERNLSANESS
jgi:hypothetical protein